MKTIYTISTSYCDNRSVDLYDDKNKWEQAVRDEASREDTRGRGDYFIVERYDIKEDEQVGVDSGRYDSGKRRPSGGSYRINYDRVVLTDADGEETRAVPSSVARVSYSSHNHNQVWLEVQPDGSLVYLVDGDEDEPSSEDGYQVVLGYMDDCEAYLTEEELNEANDPIQFIFWEQFVSLDN